MFMGSTDTMIRFLLPCTTTADEEAIDAAIEIAHSYEATLVPLLLQPAREKASTIITAVPSETQSSQRDFIKLVQNRAATMDVPLEWFELSTHDADRSIHLFAEEMDCSGILLFVSEGKGILLETDEVQYVIKHEHLTLPFLIDLIPAPEPPFPLSWLASHSHHRHQNYLSSRSKKNVPVWYPLALFALVLAIATLVYFNVLDLIKEPVFSLASLVAKIIFIGVISLSLAGMLLFSVEHWRKRQK